MSCFDDARTAHLVSNKLQGVALRTPPVGDTFIVECFIHPSLEEDLVDSRPFASTVTSVTSLLSATASQPTTTIRKILRLASSATVADTLHQLGLLPAVQVANMTDLIQCITINSGGIRTQLFSVRAASGDGSPLQSSKEAELSSQLPIREALSLRFPFTLAVTPVLAIATTKSWGLDGWSSALNAQHKQRLEAANVDFHATEMLLRQPESANDFIKHSSLGAGPGKRTSHGGPRNNSLPDDDGLIQANIIVTPAAGATTTLAPLGDGLFDANFLISAPAEHYRNGPPSTPGTARRRTSSVTMSDIGDHELQQTETAVSRKEKRAAAQAERQRLIDLQRTREANILKRERESGSKGDVSKTHVLEWEQNRLKEVEEARQRDSERTARIESRTQSTLSSKRALYEVHAARLLAKKLEYEQHAAEALRAIQSTQNASSVSPDTPHDPFQQFGNTSVDPKPLALLQPHQRMDAARRMTSAVDLPDPEETEASLLAKEQAKTSFVNRVAGARKATERRLTKLSIARFHPFAVHAELKSLLNKLDADAHDDAVRTEAQQQKERQAEHEHATFEYHRRVMDDNTQKRVDIKMERKKKSVEHHVAKIAFERVQQQHTNEAKRQELADAKQRMAAFYERKRQQEDDAKDLARREKEMESYLEHQREALRSLLIADS